MRMELQNLAFTYPNGHTVFTDINLSLETGKILTILGPNGAGKSTLLSCIANLEKPESGAVLIDGKKVSKMDTREASRLIGFVPQIHVPTYAYNVRDFVVMGRAPYLKPFQRPSKKDYNMADEILSEMNITRLSHCAYTEISGGERQQVMLARVLVQEPKYILLDEPTAHLDFGNQSKTIRTVKALAKKGYGVIITTHNPDHAFALENQVALLNRDGGLVVGHPESVLNESSLTKLYQENVYIERSRITNRMVCITGE